jgi:hypothetical protein
LSAAVEYVKYDLTKRARTKIKNSMNRVVQFEANHFPISLGLPSPLLSLDRKGLGGLSLTSANDYAPW